MRLADVRHMLRLCEIRSMGLAGVVFIGAVVLTWLGRSKQAACLGATAFALAAFLARGPLVRLEACGKGRVAVVTGASAGLGKTTAQLLVALGYRVVFAARTEALLREAAAGLQGASVAVLDLASRSSIEHFVAELPFERVDLLVCNAGLWRSAHMPDKLASGFAHEMGVNHLGHALLVHLMLPRLQRAASECGSARVVVVSSWGAFMGSFWTTTAAWTRAFTGEYRFFEWFGLAKRFKLYLNSKSANLLHAMALQEKHGTESLSFVAVHPGTVATQILLGSLSLGGILSLLSRVVFKTEEEACRTVAWAATSETLRGGEFCADGGVFPKPSGATMTSARALMQATEAALDFH
jgi:NAD(P)-dependent dehydrogenase (short-subunit alcohol dehydrogenase family)